jgi:hypothetical protein
MGHSCSDPFCVTCKTYHNPTRGCYIEQLRPKETMPAYRLLVRLFLILKSLVLRHLILKAHKTRQQILKTYLSIK